MRGLSGLSRVPKPVWVGTAAVAGLAIIVVGIVLFIRLHNAAISRQSVAELLTKADTQLSNGFYRAAEPYLEQAMKAANTRDSWLSIAKRAVQMADATGNWGLVLRVADRGTQSLPGFQELWAIKVIAQSRGGDPSGAEATAREHLTDQRFQSFGTEAVLRAHPDLSMSAKSISQSDRQIIDTLTSRDPNLFENLATEIDSPDLLFDAVLLYAWKGEMKQAYTLLVSRKADASPEAAMLISYDAGQYDSVQSYFDGIPEKDRTPTFALLADDVLVLKEEYGKAATAYLRFIQQHPDTLWMPYVDLAWLASEKSTPQIGIGQAMSHLKKAAALFPNQREVILSLATLERGAGQINEANTLLTGFLKNNPWDLDANLLNMQISGASQSPERLRSRLWELFYRASGGDRDKVARYLAWYLLGLNDYSGLQLLFQQVKSETGVEWIPFYQGIYYALEDKYAESIAEFKKAEVITDRWQTLYNLGVVELKAGDPTTAINDLQKADSALTSSNESLVKSPQRAQIHVVLAEALNRQGNTEAAKREALYAQDMDKNNLSAGLLLKKLDSSVQR